ncbi:nucleoside phosphorylase domain-containing protein [Aspergillus germanicus]
MVDLDDFTLGWICALHVELAAATCLLDERFDMPPINSQDVNHYTLGRIGQHYVTIACLPDGIYGSNLAAKTATNMFRTFKKIRLALLVGIGGGFPSPSHDIRLGDVVVGRPGMLQFDIGKSSDRGGFRPVGTLVQPPKALLDATFALESQHTLEQPKFLDYAAESVAGYPRTKHIWSYPGIEHDLLYMNNYHHSTNSDCSQSPRPLTTPKVHYGLVGSFNYVIKDGEMRDRTGKEHGILCFEMEAAGLMSDFPCLAIRGICDYADSHKNKTWQPYAAGMAAAYAKELLLLSSPNKVGSAVPAIDHLELDVNENKNDDLGSTSKAHHPSTTPVRDEDEKVD